MCRRGQLAGERLPQPSGAAVAVAAAQQPLDRLQVEQAKALGLLEGALELGGGENLGEIEQRAGDRGDRDPVPQGAVLGVEASRAMDAEPGLVMAAASDCGDVDEARGEGEQVPQRTAIAMAQQGARPAREDCGHPAALGGQSRVAYGVDAAVEGLEPFGCEAAADVVSRESQAGELLVRNHSMLVGGELCHAALGVWGFECRTTRLWKPHIGHGARVAPGSARLNARVRKVCNAGAKYARGQSPKTELL